MTSREWLTRWWRVSEDPDQSPIVRIALSIAVLVGAGYLGTYVWCASYRLPFPWDVEWMEGGMILHAARELAGKPMYAEPSLDFVSFFYTPLYPYVLAALSYLSGGLSFVLARSVSLSASLATCAMLFYVARREGGIYAACLAVGMYASLFRMSGAFYDLARADSLALALSLGACVVAFYVENTRGAVIAALLFVLAFFGKQTAALPAPCVGLYLLLTDRKRALVFGTTGVVVGASAFLLLDRHYDGWLRFYTISGHQGHEFSRQSFYLEYWRDVLVLGPFLLLIPALGASFGKYSRWAVLPFLALFAFALEQLARHLDFEPHLYFRELWYGKAHAQLLIPAIVIAVLLGVARYLKRDAEPPHYKILLIYMAAVIGSDLNQSTQWAYSNSFIPIAIYGSLYAAITIGKFANDRRDAPRAHIIASVCVLVAMLVQDVALYYNPRRQVPMQRDWYALKILRKELDAFPGPVLFPTHPLYSYLRDGTIHTHQMGLQDVDFAGGVPDLHEQLGSGKYPTIVLDGPTWIGGMDEFYEEKHVFKFPRGSLYAKTGFRSRPDAVWTFGKTQPAAQ